MSRFKPAEQNKWLPENLHPFYFLLNYRSISITSFLFSAILIPLGVIAYINNSSLQEIQLEYTNCRLAPSELSQIANGASSSSAIKRWSYKPQTKNCTLEFNVPGTMEKMVYMYIRITNFYQNSRLYVKSKDAGQLLGQVYQSASDISNSLTTCSWLQYANCDTAKNFQWIGNDLSHADNNPDCIVTPRSPLIQKADKNAQYFPCGLIANSMFSGMYF